jgi:DNA-3-methyladenine glycosylase
MKLNDMKILPKNFYERDSALVAKSLLGKILIRKIDSKILAGRIVETEAYFGEKDPASRAYLGRPKHCVELMHSKPGKILIYNVHNNWLLNVVAHEKGKAGAVLIRAIEPIEGIEEMKKNRKIKNVLELANGPGKLTKALAIDKSLNGIDSTNEKNQISFYNSEENFEIASSHRIGVTKDLPKKLRFFIKNNKFVSR